MFTNQINRSLTGENEDCGNGETPLVNPSGFITSIDQDKNGMYDSHLDCQWTIRLGFDSVIVFEVLTIDIYEQSVDCKGDFIEVRNLNKRTNGPVNAHLISWTSKAQNIQNLENI